MEAVAGLTFPAYCGAEIEVREYGTLWRNSRLYSKSYRLWPDTNVPLVVPLSKSNKAKLPVHPMVPTKHFARILLRRIVTSWKRYKQTWRNQLRIDHLLPKASSLSVTLASFAQSTENSVSTNAYSCSGEALMKHTCKVSQASYLHG